MGKVTYNPAQQEAIISDKKYVRVIAGAGAGKTQVNSEVIAHKLNALGAKPEEILAITLTIGKNLVFVTVQVSLMMCKICRCATFCCVVIQSWNGLVLVLRTTL